MGGVEHPIALHVLVIEDDADARANLRDILELDDYHVELAGTATEALARHDWASISVIILDWKLPDATAEELLPKLRRQAPDAAVLVVTAYADVKWAILALRLGAVDYLLKPINADELRARLGHFAERQRAEEKIRILTTVPAESPNPVLRVSRYGTLLYANAAAAPLLERWQCTVLDSVPEVWRQRVLEALESQLSREVEEACGQRVFSLMLAPIADRGYVNVYGSDITARKHAEEALRHERDFAENLIETAQAIVLVLDPQGRIMRFNHYLAEMSGYCLEEIKGRDWFEVFLPPDEVVRIRAVFQKTLADLSTTGTINRIRMRDGSEREIQWSNKLLKAGSGEVLGVLSIGQDITALRDSQQRALQAERLAGIGQMMTVLAHESGNALARSRACLEMLSLEVEDRPEAIDLINRIHKAQDHLQQLYEEVRGYAAPVKLEREPWSLSFVWRQAWQHLSLSRQGRDAVLQERCSGVALECPVDSFRLEQVFRNLFENALAACKDPVRLDITCTDAELDGVPALRVSVHDNGPGLNAEQRQKIFEPFYTTKVKGTGLGMAIARRILEAHGGRIAVGHAPGGAEIMLTLPRQ